MPADARVYTVLGQLYLDADQPWDALRVCTAGRRAAPHAEGVLRALMDCYARLGQSAERASVAAVFQKVLASHDRINHLTYVMSFDHQNTAAGLELARLEEEEGRYARAQAFYEQLVRRSQTLGTWTGYAAAVGGAKGPEAGLAVLDGMDPDDVSAYQPYWAVRAHLLQRLGKTSEAVDAFDRAIGLAEDPAVRQFLLQRRG